MISIHNLYKTFHANTINENKVITDLSLKIEDGDFITVIGGNGAGKSTLLNLIAGSIMMDEGKIFIDDVDVSKMVENKRAKYISRVFQDPNSGTCKDLSIEENMSIAKRRGKIRTLRKGILKSEKSEYQNLLKTLDLGLENRLNAKVGLLSGGQRQALTLLMATLVKPKLLLLDEHTAALDPKTAKTVLELTEKIVAENKLTTLMVTHNMKDAINYGNRLIMMNKGKIVLDIKGEEKKNLTVNDLLIRFEASGDDNIISDRMLLD